MFPIPAVKVAVNEVAFGPVTIVVVSVSEVMIMMMIAIVIVVAIDPMMIGRGRRRCWRRR